MFVSLGSTHMLAQVNGQSESRGKTVLYIVGCLSASLNPAHLMLVAPPWFLMIRNAPRPYPMPPDSRDCLQMRMGDRGRTFVKDI